jgi:hypothetical protein
LAAAHVNRAPARGREAAPAGFCVIPGAKRHTHDDVSISLESIEGTRGTASLPLRHAQPLRRQCKSGSERMTARAVPGIFERRSWSAASSAGFAISRLRAKQPHGRWQH